MSIKSFLRRCFAMITLMASVRAYLHPVLLQPRSPARPYMQKTKSSVFQPMVGPYLNLMRRLAAAKDRSYVNADDIFELTLDDFDQILEAVQLFQRIYGDCNIQSRFEVPAEPPWPPSVHGLRLGRRLEKLQTSQDFMQKHPEKVKALAAIGWNPHTMNLVEEWDVLLECLKIYKAQYGDLRVPSKFVIPHEDPWPRTARGMKFGVRVAAIRSAGRYVKENPARKAELDALHFEWRLRDTAGGGKADEARFSQLCRALEHYKGLVEPQFAMNAKYVVPASANWPEELWGLKLGYEVRQMRRGAKYVKGRPDRLARLSALGFTTERPASANDPNRRWDAVLLALQTHHQLYGHVDVPLLFEVPEGDPAWPETTWGLRLGKRVLAIRTQSTFVSNSPERRAMLDALGFAWELGHEVRRKQRSSSSTSTRAGAPAHRDSSDDSRGATHAAAAGSKATAVEPDAVSVTMPTKRGRKRKDSVGTAAISSERSADTDASKRPRLKRAGSDRTADMVGTEDAEDTMDTDTDTEDTADLLVMGDADLVGEILEQMDPEIQKEIMRRELEEQEVFERELQRILGLPVPSFDASAEGIDRAEPNFKGWNSQPAQTTTVHPAGGDDDAVKTAAVADHSAGELFPSLGVGEGGTYQAPAVAVKKSAQPKPQADLSTMPPAPTRVSEAIDEEESEFDDPTNAFSTLPGIPDRHLIPASTYAAAGGRIAPFDSSFMFARDRYSETAAQAMLDEMIERESSSDPDVRQWAHFGGYLSPHELNERLARPIAPDDVAYMRRQGYRIMEFGRFCFEDVVEALQVYRAHYGHVEVPVEYVVSDAELRRLQRGGGQGQGGDLSRQLHDGRGSVGADALPQYNPRYLGMPLGEAVLSLRIGDVDGLEDPSRRQALDALGFDWGDKSKHLRFRSPPLLLGLRIYKHLNGFPVVDSAFVVPDEPQWPIWMIGMPLGEWAAAARIQQQVLREHYPERVEVLNAMGFLWWIPPGPSVPERYYQPLP